MRTESERIGLFPMLLLDTDLFQTLTITCVIIQYFICEIVAPILENKSRFEPERCCVLWG
jgi:hypothetical protein